MKAAGLVLALCVLVQGPAHAQTWSPIADGGVVGARFCQPVQAGRDAAVCVSIECEDTVDARVFLTAPEPALPDRFAGTITVDGISAARLEFVRQRPPEEFGLYIAATSGAPGLIDALLRGTTAQVLAELAVPPTLSLTMSLGGSLTGVAPLLSECRPASTAPVASGNTTPDSHPDQFIAWEKVAQASPETEALARQLLQPQIAEAEAGAGNRIDLFAEMVAFNDGRRLLLVTLCDPIWFGITGCASHFLASAPGTATFSPAAEIIGGGPYWLDLTTGVAGWPDVLSQPHTAAPGQWARFRWTGVGYASLGIP